MLLLAYFVTLLMIYTFTFSSANGNLSLRNVTQLTASQ